MNTEMDWMKTRIMITALLLAAASGAYAADAPQGPPPALVAVEAVRAGKAEPMAEFVGSVAYHAVSDVASEVAGVVVEVNYDEGTRVTRGQVLARLNTELLEAGVAGVRASHEQALIEIEQAERDMGRMVALYAEQSVSEVLREDSQFKVRQLRQKAAALEASLARLELERAKASIRAPFDGIAVARPVDLGEWVGAGGTVAVLADASRVDVVVNVPEGTLGLLKVGRQVAVTARDRRYTGTYTAFVPRGDVATRTFAIKLGIKGAGDLYEGMEARAMLPTGSPRSGLLVPRDAVINQFGRDVVFVAVDGVARMIPVRVTGYEGSLASVEGEGLSVGQMAVTKGNERLREGQPVRFMEAGQ